MGVFLQTKNSSIPYLFLSFLFSKLYKIEIIPYHVGNPKITGKMELDPNSMTLNSLFPKSVITEFYKFVMKDDAKDIEYDPTMIDSIDHYIDINSPRWIYSPILRSKPDSRYIVFLVHYYDRKPGMQVIINSKLSPSTLESVESLKKSFKLGC